MTSLVAASLPLVTGCTMIGSMEEQERITHVTVNYTEHRIMNQKTFALTPEVMKRAQAWRAQAEDRSAADFSNWLHRNGAKLDKDDGPAWNSVHIDSGYKVEEWYRNGDYFRPGGEPEVVETGADGFRREAWVRKGDITQVVETDSDKNMRWVRRKNGDVVAKGNGFAQFNIPGVTVLPPGFDIK
ncbi:MAG: hypothetical protein HY370_10230 [Proteobacteria bacterium]|nr:hypothetical protein [Pseudomonadota bacterium]